MPLEQVSEIRSRLVTSKSGKTGRQRFADFKCSYCQGISEKHIGGANRVESCGCQQKRLQSKAKTKHGSRNTRAYRSWQSMIQRATNSKRENFKNYGGRGITICDRWLNSFETFLGDMGECPTGHSLDRIDNSKGYEPGNCRWATQIEQQRNRTNNHILTINGVSRCLSEWAEQPGAANRGTIRTRLKLNWPHKEAVFGKERQK